MTWAPWLAIGGGLLALGPIIIHIIFRRRYRSVDFAAMRFVRESMRRNKQRIRREEWILLVLRVLACIFIGLTLANVRAETYDLGVAARTAHVLILDDSLSMSQRIGTTTLARKATDHIVDTIERLPDEDLVSVILASRRPGDQPFAELSPIRDWKQNDTASRLRAIAPTDRRADFEGALEEAARLLTAEQESQKRVYLATDFRQHEFGGPDRSAALRQRFGQLDEATVDLVLLDFGAVAKSNLTIERIEPASKLVVAGVRTPIKVTVRNNGSEPSDAVMLTPRIAGEHADAEDTVLPVVQAPPLQPGEEATVECGAVFASPGAVAFKAALPLDALPGDNEAALALRVREALRVLIVDGSNEPSSTKSASFCLAFALDPSGEGQFRQRVDVMRADTGLPPELSTYDLVIFTNVPNLPASRDESEQTTWPALRKLEQYVREGGGLIVFPGDRVDANFYNGPFHSNGNGLLPAKLPKSIATSDDEADTSHRLMPDSIREDSILRIFTGRGEQFSRLVRFHRFVEMQPADAKDVTPLVGPARVLARFDNENRSPAAVWRRHGDGAVLQWAVSPTVEWTDWPRDLTFLPVMNDMAWWMARQDAGAYHGPVGQAIAYEVPHALRDATSITLRTPAFPAQDMLVMTPTNDGGRQLIRQPVAEHAGVYELAFTLADQSTQLVRFSRYVDPSEGRTAKATREQIATAVGREHTYHGDLAVASAEAASFEPVRAYWWVFLALVLICLATENFLARRFAHHKAGLSSARRASV